MNPELSLRTRKNREPPRQREGRLVLDTDLEWVLEGPPELVDGVFAALPEFAEHISPRHLLLAFQNAVGRYTLPGLGEIELVSGKWSEAEFDGMLRELTEVVAGLPFASRVGSGLPYERAALAERQVPYHAYVYLRYALSATTPSHDRLDLAFNRVLAQPQRRLMPNDRMVRLECARNIGVRGMLRALASPWDWREQTSAERRDLPIALGGYLPERIEEEQRSSSADTAENRFVAAVLDLAYSIIERTKRHAASCGRVALRNRLLQDCDQMLRVLEPIRAHALWREVGAMMQFPASSVVLQRRSGYREILRGFVRLRLISRIPHKDDAINDLLALKDIATLYELWCFFSVVRAVKQHLGAPSEPVIAHLGEAETSVSRGMRVRWRDGTTVIYNAQFNPKSSNRSTSVALRPDVALYVTSGRNRGLHLLDAKFRLRTTPGNGANQNDATTTFKPDDLIKMHAYRDAIPEARSVWIMCPATTCSYFPSGDGAADEYDGVGAIPTHPGGKELDRVIGQMLGKAAMSEPVE